MLKKINPGSVKAPTYTFQLDRDKLKYFDTKLNRSINVALEHDVKPFVLVIYSNSIKFWLQPDEVTVTNDEKNQILQNIDEGLTFLNVMHKFV